jgi:hypothetical protein
VVKLLGTSPFASPAGVAHEPAFPPVGSGHFVASEPAKYGGRGAGCAAGVVGVSAGFSATAVGDAGGESSALIDTLPKKMAEMVKAHTIETFFKLILITIPLQKRKKMYLVICTMAKSVPTETIICCEYCLLG